MYAIGGHELKPCGRLATTDNRVYLEAPGPGDGLVGRDRIANWEVLSGHAECDLVAMEALARGTPVVTSGADMLADIVEHGRMGFVVGSECRRAAERRFSARRMIGEYLALYERLLAA